MNLLEQIFRAVLNGEATLTCKSGPSEVKASKGKIVYKVKEVVLELNIPKPR